MKKVDMIKLMSALYVKHLDEHGCIIIDLFMEDILKVQTDAGMLAPSRKIDLNEANEIACLKEVYQYQEYHKWDKADEE